MKNNEWYTPEKYVNAVREVMGENISLDPASCELANKVVRAERYYTEEQDGLMQEWHADTLFMNPPYGRVHPERAGSTQSYQKAFAEKLLLEYRRGNVKQAISLSLGNPNSVWFQPFFDHLICFNRERICFHRPDGSTSSFGFPLAFTYLGPHESQFLEVFSQFGPVVSKVRT
jgi:hypothetical protein